MSSYQQIDLSEWVLVGEGYNGQAYVSKVHPDVMLKLVLRELGSASNVEKEFLASKTAYEMGLPVPQVYEIVRNGKTTVTFASESGARSPWPACEPTIRSVFRRWPPRWPIGAKPCTAPL